MPPSACRSRHDTLTECPHCWASVSPSAQRWWGAVMAGDRRPVGVSCTSRGGLCLWYVWLCGLGLRSALWERGDHGSSWGQRGLHSRPRSLGPHGRALWPPGRLCGRWGGSQAWPPVCHVCQEGR